MFMLWGLLWLASGLIALLVYLHTTRPPDVGGWIVGERPMSPDFAQANRCGPPDS